jgi:hypothetical protein
MFFAYSFQILFCCWFIPKGNLTLWWWMTHIRHICIYVCNLLPWSGIPVVWGLWHWNHGVFACDLFRATRNSWSHPHVSWLNTASDHVKKKHVSWLSCNTPGFIGVLHPCFFEKNHGVKPHLRSQTGPGRIVYLAVALATGDFCCHVKPLIFSMVLAMY